MNAIKHLKFVTIFIFIGIGIQSCQNKSSSNRTLAVCPDEPKAKLDNIEEIKLTSTTKSIDGMTANNRPKGYKFTGKKGQKITYHVNNNTCMWLYDLNNKIMDSPILPQDGIYVLQIASSEGSGTFQLDLSIDSVNRTPEPVVSQNSTSSQVATQPNSIVTRPSASVDPTPDSKPTQNTDPSQVSTQPSQTVNRPSAEEAVRSHYQLINNGNLTDSWNNLSDNFKGANLDKGKKEYEDWWNQVSNINVRSLKLIRQDRDKAILRMSLSYTLKNGRIVDDSHDRLYLIWDDTNKKWLVNDRR